MKNRIADLRKKINITQQELAERVNVTRQTIISLEFGRYNPSLELAYKITKTLKQKYLKDVFDLKSIKI
jgi:putative transcriptional regulator